MYGDDDLNGDGMGNDNFVKFECRFGSWDVYKYPNGNVFGMGNGNRLKFSCNIVILFYKIFLGKNL